MYENEDHNFEVLQTEDFLTVRHIPSKTARSTCIRDVMKDTLKTPKDLLEDAEIMKNSILRELVKKQDRESATIQGPLPNGLTPAQAERLYWLAEEAAEVIQIVNKVLRLGYESKHPEKQFNNRQELEKELGDFELALSVLTMHDVEMMNIIKCTRDKYRKIKEGDNYFHHQDFENDSHLDI